MPQIDNVDRTIERGAPRSQCELVSRSESRLAVNFSRGCFCHHDAVRVWILPAGLHIGPAVGGHSRALSPLRVRHRSGPSADRFLAVYAEWNRLGGLSRSCLLSALKRQPLQGIHLFWVDPER